MEGPHVPRIIQDFRRQRPEAPEVSDRSQLDFEREHYAAITEVWPYQDLLATHKNSLNSLVSDERMQEGYALLTRVYRHDWQWHRFVWAVTASDLALMFDRTVLLRAAHLCSSIARTCDHLSDQHAAEAKDHRTGENPAAWKGNLVHFLSARQKLARGHSEAMPYDQVPAFMKRLRAMDAVARRALEFTILTAARSGEIRGAKWNEIDVEAKVWTVPAQRMKMGREHRVPLSDRALAILAETKPMTMGDGLIFPGRHGRPLSDMTLDAVLRRL